jgi:hypothetical protein
MAEVLDVRATTPKLGCVEDIDFVSCGQQGRSGAVLLEVHLL